MSRHADVHLIKMGTNVNPGGLLLETSLEAGQSGLQLLVTAELAAEPASQGDQTQQAGDS